MPSQTDNPFAPPESGPPVSSDPASEDVPNPTRYWMIVFCLNVPMPWMMGTNASRGDGQPGMLLGCISVFSVGIWLCQTNRRLMAYVSIGGVLTSLSQFMPVLQMCVGFCAIAIVNSLTGAPNSGPELEGVGEVGAATILTGLGLILPALFLGWVLQTISAFSNRKIDQP